MQTGGASVELRVTAASGDSVVISATAVAAATAAWFTGTLTIDRENLANADSGGQASRLFGDALTVELKRTGGTNVTITGLCVGEAL